MSEGTRKLIRHTRKHTSSRLIMTVAVMLALTTIAGATPIPAALGLNWSASNMSAAVSPTCIDFFNVGLGCGTPATMTLGASDATFGVPGTTTGTTNDYLVANQASFTPGTFSNYSGGTAFMTLASPLGPFTFDVTQIFVPPVATAPPTPACSPVSNPSGNCYIEDFTLTQTSPNTVLVGFTTAGRGYVTGTNPNTTGSTAYTFVYSTQVGGTIADLVAAANAGQTIVGQSVSLSAFGTNVPEPMTFLMMGLGLAGIGMLKLRKRKA